MLTSFQKLVYAACKKIPLGKVSTYQEIARKIGHPAAYRAVGNALNTNPFAPKVPCHRVVKSDGQIGGFAFGGKKKLQLLQKEGVKVKNNRIVDFKGRFYKFFA